MSSLASTSASWWASSRRSARGAVIGAILLVTGLAATSAVVWTSPESAGSRMDAVVAAVNGDDRLRDERATLLDRLVGLKGDLAESDGRLDASRADAAALREELDITKAELADYKEQLAAALAKSSTAKPGAGGGATPSTKPPTASTTISAPSKAELVAPASPYFGMYTEQAPFNWGGFDATAAKVGSMPGVVGYFSGWDEGFRANAVERAWKRGMLPMMTWESRPIGAGNDESEAPDYALSRILAGDFDAYLHTYAQQIVATGLPLGIRLDHEMNGDWYPWSESVNGNSTGEYAQMWRHVHDIFAAEGANDFVIWTWAPNRVDKLSPAARGVEFTRSLYPGDEYVDWVGMSAYLRPPFRAGQEIGFDQTFDATLTQLREIAPGKPIMLAEVGASESEGYKVDWLASFFAGINSPENADIVGFSWFSLAISSYVDGELATNDWRIDSRAASLEAFRTGLLGTGTRFVPRQL